MGTAFVCVELSVIRLSWILFRALTVNQSSIIGYYAAHTRAQFLGLDQNELPVLRFRDRRRLTEPFAIPRSTRRRGSTEPAYPLRWFTEQELDAIDPLSHEILSSLWKEVT